MIIRIISNPITTMGSFNRGDILTSDKYPEYFLKHLVEEARAAEYIETKMIQPVTENKAEFPEQPKKKRGRPRKSGKTGQTGPAKPV